MKIQKRFVALLICAVLAVLSIVALTGCGDCDHEWGEWITTADATCYGEGEAYRVCAKDSTHVETKTLEKKEHTYGEFVSTGVPTCTEAGLLTATCTNSFCGDTKVVLDPAKGHTFTTYQPKDATCDAPSCEVATCDSGCGATDVRAVENATPALGHSFNDDKICETCGDYDEFIAQYDISEEGSSVTATIYDTGKMFNKTKKKLMIIITGSGSVKNDPTTPMPWAKDYADLIVEAKIADGIVSLANEIFLDHDELVTVTLPEGLLAISHGVFNGCSELTEVTVPASVQVIGKLAFAGCTKLTSVTFAEGSQLASIWAAAFEDCRRITELALPDSLKELNENAFLNCSTLATVTVPEDIEYVAANAFDGTVVALTEYEGAAYLALGENPYAILLHTLKDAESCVIHKDTVMLATYAFNGADLTSISVEADNTVFTSSGNCVMVGSELVVGIKTSVIPDTVDTIGMYAFLGCEGLTELTIPEGVRTIETYAFAECTKLTEVVIPETVELISSGAFYGCTSLESITLPFTGSDRDGSLSNNLAWIFGAGVDSLPASLKSVTLDGTTEIAAGAFEGCATIKEITIPETVTVIGKAAFSGCVSLTTVNASSLESWLGIEFKDYLSNPITYSKSLTVNGAELTELVIPEGITEIKFAAFAGFKALTSITLPAGLEIIGTAAFKDCSALTTIVIPAGVTEISDSAFSGCTALSSVTLSNSLTAIAPNVFNSCANLLTVNIPASVQYIDTTAFIGCTRLTAVTVDAENANYLSFDGIVYDKASYDIVFIPAAIAGELELLDGLTAIGATTLGKLPYVDTLTIPASVTTVAKGALSGLTKLKTLVTPFVGASVDNEADNSIGFMFGTVPSTLTSVKVTAGTKIADEAFAGCTSIVSISLPEGVTSIGAKAFSGCTSLTTVFLPASVTAIEGSAFESCTKFNTIYYYGTADDFAALTVDNVYFKAAKVYFFNESYTAGGDGTNWYFDQDGDIVLW